MDNPSVLLYGPGQAKIEDRPIPELSNGNDVIVQISYVGVCGSDVHFWKHGGIRTFVSASKPLTMGHEAAGIVHAVGDRVTSLKPGDRVAIEPGIPCRQCQACKAGRYNLCPDMAFAADPPLYHGTLTKFYLTASDFCYKLPDETSLPEAVLMEPLAVAVHSVRQAILKPGETVIVFGAGTVGLLCAAVAREYGASVIGSVDLLPQKLEFAKSFVGEDVVRTAQFDIAESPEVNAQRLVQRFDLGAGAHVCIDATGAESCIQTSLLSLRLGGTHVQTGMGKRKADLPIAEICERELNVKGSFRYGAGDFELALSLVQRGRIDVKALISKEFAFEDATEAWEATSRGEGVKNLIRGASD